MSASVLLELDALFGSLKVVDLTGLPKIQMNGRELRGATIDHASMREVVEVVVSDEVDAA